MGKPNMWYNTTLPPRGLWCAARKCLAAALWWRLVAIARLVISTGVKESCGRELGPRPKWASLINRPESLSLRPVWGSPGRLKWKESLLAPERKRGTLKSVVSARQWSEGAVLNSPSTPTHLTSAFLWTMEGSQEPPEKLQELSWWSRWKRTPKVTCSEETSRKKAFKLQVA